MNKTSQDRNYIPMPIRKVSPDPIWYVKRAVTSKRKQIMRCDSLSFAGPLQQKELWQDSHALKPDGERPKDFGWVVVVWEEHGEDQRASEQVLYAEGVEVRVVGWFVDSGHQVNGVAGGGEEEELEDGVVGAVGEGPEEIDITRYVDNQI